MSGAREQILARIRGSVRGGGQEAARAEHAAIPRDYRRAGALDEAGRLALLEDRLREYGAGVYRCDEADIAQTVAQVLQSRGKTEMLVPPSVPAAWLPEGFAFRAGAGLSHAELDAAQGVMTGCAGAVALSGTIFLRHSEQQGRRAITLIPDYHLCVVWTSQVRETLAEGLAHLNDGSPLLLTTISGPSATSDIEMTRVKGVHGPRLLDVILATPRS